MYVLPTDEDSDGLLDHLTLVAAGGFGEREVEAITSLRQIRSRNRLTRPVEVLLAGVGTLEDYTALPLRPSVCWKSATPYIATRHPKPRRAAASNEEETHLARDLSLELERLLARRPDLASVEATGALTDAGPRTIEGAIVPARAFVRARAKADDGGYRPCGFATIRFSRAVRGPIALGWSAHFGMGLFLPEAGPC